MNSFSRRAFLGSALGATASLAFSLRARAAEQHAITPGGLRVAPFRFEVTPPKGHSLCGGWIKPVDDYDDPLEAIGYVLLGAGKPLVFCTVDWTGILNDAHVEWRTVLADAAGTTPDRVALHCVHQHNAPFVCLEARRLAEEQGDLPRVFEWDFYRRCLDLGHRAVQDALAKARQVTHVAHGRARVVDVASNRRVARDSAGRISVMRGSSCKDAALIALPEGLIDPWLQTIAFYDGNRRVVACHFYATHPMSYYGNGRVSSDFCGLARRLRQATEPECTHLYFTGCAGNVAAGKYNDGTPAARQRLMRRMFDGIVAAEAASRREPIARVEWRTEEIVPMVNPTIATEPLRELLATHGATPVQRLRPAFKLAFLDRCRRQVPFVLGGLRLNDVSSLYLPAEPFVEYQLRAQEAAGRPVAVAAYGDNGPWYIPTQPEYPAGGYEVEHAFVAAGIDPALRRAIERLAG